MTVPHGDETQVERPRTADVGRTMFWLTFGTLLYLAAQWVLTVIVFKLAGPEANGDYTLGLSSSNVAYAVVMFGMRPYQISDTRGEFADRTYFASRALTSLLAIGSALLIFPVHRGLCAAVASFGGLLAVPAHRGMDGRVSWRPPEGQSNG
ncbi:hypothetical protein [Propioniciclava flava]